MRFHHPVTVWYDVVETRTDMTWQDWVRPKPKLSLSGVLSVRASRDIVRQLRHCPRADRPDVVLLVLCPAPRRVVRIAHLATASTM